MTRRFAGILMAGVLLAGLLPGAAAGADPKRSSAPLPRAVSDLKLDKPISVAGAATAIDKRLAAASGPQRVIVRLTASPVIAVAPTGATAQKVALSAIRVQQDRVIAKAHRLDSSAKLLGRTGKASNVVMLSIDAAALPALARDPAVETIVPVKDYQLDLSETVPYIGARTVQNLGFKGAGVDVAILDSGVDYTHAALGGPGTIAAYQAAYGTSTADPLNTTRDGLFPTARVKGGRDFVGEGWPGTDASPIAETQDPDPIDSPDSGTELGVLYGSDGGHGTHVADIIGGTRGVAPKANLYAVKVCSSVSTACSGVALLEGVDWAMDPNGDGSLSDHVDIINMSLGQDYGTVADDDLSLAAERANYYAGILVVASAGNGANKPYIAGTPAAAPSVLAVAQTQVPSARAFPLVLTAPPDIAGTYPNTETVDWAPLGSGFDGDVVFVGQGCPAGSIEPGSAEDPYLANPSGKVALIDRGACSISLKVDRATKAGATGVLIGLVAPGDAVSFSFGGGDLPMVPTMVIQESLSDAIKEQLAIPVTVHARVSSATSIRLVGSLAGSSSRGPGSNNRIKPEIGAPGASVSAVSGSGAATQAFGGTSGAAPMVTGAAALLKGAFPKRTALEIKAVLMNTAETTIQTNPALTPGVLAPITRIGGGELRVDRALRSQIAIWDPFAESGSLSFGFVDGTKTVVVTRKLLLRNYSNKVIPLAVTPTFRSANDKANGAVKISAPRTFFLYPKATRWMTVTATIDARKLRKWSMDGGGGGTDPSALDLMEYDGYLNFNRTDTRADNADPIHVAWQVLPRKSGSVRAVGGATVAIGGAIGSGPLAGLPGGTKTLSNIADNVAAVDAYSLVAQSPKQPPAKPGTNHPVIDLRAVGVQTFLVPANTVCDTVDSFVYRIAINTWARQTTAIVPGELDVDIDVNGDGQPDFDVFSAPASITAANQLGDGRALTFVYDYAADALDAWFYTDSGTNDSNTILTFCGDQIGLTQADLGTPLTMSVTAYDWLYHAYSITDQINDIHVAPFGERYVGIVGNSVDPIDIPARSTATVTVGDFGPAQTNPSEIGLLLVLNADRGAYRGGAAAGRDMLALRVAPAP